MLDFVMPRNKRFAVIAKIHDRSMPTAFINDMAIVLA